jgi:hypothetical protein
VLQTNIQKFLAAEKIDIKNNTFVQSNKTIIHTELATMSDIKRVQLDTKIEQEVHRLVKNISEQMYDKVQLYARKNNLQVDPEVLTHILKTVQVVISEVELNSIDQFHSKIKTVLDDYTGDENPTDLTNLTEPTKKARAKSATV